MLPARIPQLGSAAAAQDVFLSIFGRQCLFEHLTNRQAAGQLTCFPFAPSGRSLTPRRNRRERRIANAFRGMVASLGNLRGGA